MAVQTAGVLPAANLLYQQGGPQPFPGWTNTWFNPLQTQGWETQMRALNAAMPQTIQNQLLAHSMQGRFNNSLSGMQNQVNQMAGQNVANTKASFDPFNNPWLQRNVRAANAQLSRDFRQGILPSINLNAAMSGMGGGSRHGVAQGIASQGLADAMQRQTSGLYNQGINTGMTLGVQDRANTMNAMLGSQRNLLSGQQNILGGLAQMPGMYGMTSTANMGPSSMLQALGTGQANIGNAYNARQQAFQREERDRWNAAQWRPYGNLNWYSNVVNRVPMGGFGTSTTAQRPPSTLGNVMGGAMTGAGLYNWYNQNYGSGGGTGGGTWV